MTAPNLCRAWRKAAGLTQAQAADFLGLGGKQRVNEYETGRRPISARSRKLIERDIAARCKSVEQPGRNRGGCEAVPVSKGGGGGGERRTAPIRDWG